MIDLKGLRCDLTMIEVKQQFVNELIARM
jgi:hypothetical protein